MSANKNRPLSAEEQSGFIPALRERLSYCAESGVVTWAKPTSTRIKAGDVVGCPDKDGYLVVVCFGRYWKAHRLAWAFTHGEFPAVKVDHKNGVKSDNRIENLRLASNFLNGTNLLRAKSNNTTSGLLGVSMEKRSGQWIAQIQSHGKKRRIGLFPSAEEAFDAYLLAKRTEHPGASICQG